MRTLSSLRMLGLLAGFVAATIAPAKAEFVPERPIEVVTHNGPGSGNDLLARQISAIVDHAKLSPQRLTVLNKPGGGSTNASSYMLSKEGDPGTISVWTSVWILDPLLQEEATTKISQLTPIALLVEEPALVVARADSPFQSVADFINAAKAEPGKLKQAGGSISARENILRQQIMSKTGAKWAYVSFPGGGERLSALLGGHVDMMIVDPGEASELVRGGKVKVLAQVGDQRLPAFKDVPTLKEAGFDVDTFAQARGILGPPNMPADAVTFYADLLKKVTETPEWAKYVEENHLVNADLPPDETRKYLENYESEIRTLLTEAGVKVVR
jgi:putative tricarboxylic transport membrane protein